MNKKEKLKKLETEESKTVKKFIIVLLLVIICIVGVYVFTNTFVTNNKDQDQESNVEVEFNYDKIILGSTFNRPYNEYYVITYKSSDENAYSLSEVITTYKQKEDAIKIYFADLDDYMNQEFYDVENVNKKATMASELKVGDYTLIKINDGSINKYIEGINNITKELK